MPNPPQQLDPRVLRYLVSTLQKNPVDESALIIDRRSRLVGLKKKSESKAKPTQDLEHTRQKRQQLLTRVEELRKNIWQSPLEEIQSVLQKIDARQFPDIDRATRRLATIANYRSQLPKLASHPHFDGDFFVAFKKVLTSSPQEAAVLKEKVVISFGKKNYRQSGQKMIKLLQAKMPDLFELESAWFTSLLKQKKNAHVVAIPAEDTSTTTVTSDEGTSWWIYVLVFVLIRIIIRIAND